MRRRAFIGLVGGVTVWSLGAGAQQHVPTIGVLALGTPDPDVFIGALRSGLRDLGYDEGQNIRLILRSAQGKAEALPNLAAELARLPADVIVGFQTPAVVA